MAPQFADRTVEVDDIEDTYSKQGIGRARKTPWLPANLCMQLYTM